jgi:LDH2 family malate/lactate/ureidoglycolate dehydrogenase
MADNSTSTVSADGATYVNHERLHQFVIEILTRVDVAPEDARIVADVLVAADLRAVHSHGVARLQSYYVSRIRAGLIVPRPQIAVLHETPVSLRIDAGNGLGHPVSHWAMTRTIEKAQVSGVAMAAVRNSNHFGIAGYYAMMALKHEMIGVCLTNTTPLVMPVFSRELLTGTNPIAMAVPAKNRRPWVLDMATSVVPKGKLEVYARAGKPMPDGWAVDKDGLPTTDPQAALAGGAPMPLGGTRDIVGHTGYDLEVMVDILSGVLSGSNFAAHIPPSGAPRPFDLGHFFMAFRPDLFMPTDQFTERMDQIIDDLSQAAPAKGAERVLVAGQPEDEAEERYRQTGIPLDPPTAKALRQLSDELGVPFPG